MFRAHVLIVRRSKLHYIASGIITLIGGRPVHRLTEMCEKCGSEHVNWLYGWHNNTVLKEMEGQDDDLLYLD